MKRKIGLKDDDATCPRRGQRAQFGRR